MAVASVATNISVEGVVTGIWPEVVRKTIFDDSVTGVGLRDSLVKIDPTVIIDLLLSSLAFVAEICVSTEDVVVSVGPTLRWVVGSEDIIIEGGVGEIMGIEN